MQNGFDVFSLFALDQRYARWQCSHLPERLLGPHATKAKSELTILLRHADVALWTASSNS